MNTHTHIETKGHTLRYHRHLCLSRQRNRFQNPFLRQRVVRWFQVRPFGGGGGGNNHNKRDNQIRHIDQHCSLDTLRWHRTLLFGIHAVRIFFVSMFHRRRRVAVEWLSTSNNGSRRRLLLSRFFSVHSLRRLRSFIAFSTRFGFVRRRYALFR